MLIMAIGSACQASVGIGMARFVAPLLALIEPRFIPGPMLPAGVMGTMVGIHGLPIALVFQHARPDMARAMLGAFFGFAYVGTVVALAAVGLVGRPELSLAAMLLPGVVAGLLVAPFIAERIDQHRLRYAILLISASSGAILLLR